MPGQIWFGTLYDRNTPGNSTTGSNARMQWVPAPDSGMDAGSTGYSELLEFENGGADVVSSAATHRNFEMNWNVRQANGRSGLDTIKSYQQGAYGPGLIYFADPMSFSTNMFPPHWSTPSLSAYGWKSPAYGAGTYPAVTYALSESYNLPRRAFTSDPTLPSGNALALADPGPRIAVIPIPPGYKLHVQFRHLSGAGMGGLIGVRAIFSDGQYATSSTIAMNPIGTGSPTVFSGSTYKAVEFWVNGAVAGWIDSIAQLWPESMASPPLPLSTIAYAPGGGHTGTKFTTDAIVETYIMGPRQLKGMSATLTEVGLWQKAGT